jgi:hypothetical protein
MKKLGKNWRRYVRLSLSERVLAQWWHPVAFSEALDLLYWAMRAVLYCHIAMVIDTASKVGVLFDCHFVDCCPGGRRGNTEQVVARWRLPGASSVDLDLLHRAMPCSSLQRIRTAIEMACNGGTFVRQHRFYHQP